MKYRPIYDAMKLEKIPKGMNEMQVTRLLRERAAEDGLPLCFLGAGCLRNTTSLQLFGKSQRAANFIVPTHRIKQKHHKGRYNYCMNISP